ncbi:hypothetical protein MtrunA17_Chr3g0130051 [Medicago truncatula]|uniref:Transmembrane protein n=1 Tax=Medicago truncatula TaxID=3880 RepID=A0A396IZQ1_MEDTR|nr:hypothetical protein MtrunA17_Chr3g0130051 [Medicago truncatula]
MLNICCCKCFYWIIWVVADSFRLFGCWLDVFVLFFLIDEVLYLNFVGLP